MDVPKPETEKEVKAPTKAKAKTPKPLAYAFAEGNTEVVVTGINDKQGKALEACLKGQVERSTDWQLECAIDAHLRRMRVSHGKPIIKRG